MGGVGWSDLLLFQFSKRDTFLPIRFFRSSKLNCKFFSPKMDKTVFDLNNTVVHFFEFLFFFSFKKIKEYIPSCRRFQRRV